MKLVLRKANALKKYMKSNKESFELSSFLPPLGILNPYRNLQRSSYLGYFLLFYKACLFSCDLNAMCKCKADSLEFILYKMPFLFQKQSRNRFGNVTIQPLFPFWPKAEQATMRILLHVHFSCDAGLTTASLCWDAEGETQTVFHH